MKGTTTQTIGFTLFYSEMLEVLFGLRWGVILCALLIACDLILGSRESLEKGTDFTLSRAVRRTFSKVVEYLLYLSIGATIGKAILEAYGIPQAYGTVVALSIVTLIETDSVVGHVLYLRGYRFRFSLFSFIFYLAKGKHKEITDAAEAAVKQPIEDENTASNRDSRANQRKRSRSQNN